MTETVYVNASDGTAIGRVVYAANDPITGTSGRLHVFFELDDQVFSTSMVIDRDSGELVERATYQAYGGPDSDYRPDRWGNFREAYRYMGHEDDAEVGLVYFGQRYYSPTISRWVSPDPVNVHALGSDPNPYAFVRGSPAALVDPNGLDVDCDIMTPGCEGDQQANGDPDPDQPKGQGGGGSPGGRGGGRGTSPPQFHAAPPPPPTVSVSPQQFRSAAYDTATQAGYAALRRYNRTSVGMDREIGGLDLPGENWTTRC